MPKSSQIIPRSQIPLKDWNRFSSSTNQKNRRNMECRIRTLHSISLAKPEL